MTWAFWKRLMAKGSEPSLLEAPHGQGERADVIVVAMGNGDGVQFGVVDGAEEGKGGAAFAFGVHAGVHEETAIVEMHEPATGPDGGVRIKIYDSHENLQRPWEESALDCNGAPWEKKELKKD